MMAPKMPNGSFDWRYYAGLIGGAFGALTETQWALVCTIAWTAVNIAVTIRREIRESQNGTESIK